MFYKNLFLFFIPFLFSVPLFAQDSGMLTAEEILAAAHPESENPTPCATKIFADALYDRVDEVDPDTPEAEVRAWAKTVMFDADVLEDVLDCPEIKSVDDMTTIVFTPIVFEFETGRTITINYTTQPKVLKQKLSLAKKPSLPNGDPNPRLMDENDPAIYINTDPAWYAIMVVEHDSLSNFVGENKNNTLSLKWLDNNIDNVYPKGFNCTSKSAIALDSDTINNVVREIADIEDDPNDYYVAGDVNLEWIMYAEVAADIILTVVTFGAGEAALLGLKGTRAAKTGIRLAKNMRIFEKSVHVQKYVDMTRKIARTSEKIAKAEKNIKNAARYEKALKRAEEARSMGMDATKYEKQAEKIFQNAKKIDPDITRDTLKNADKLKDNVKELEKEAEALHKELEQTLKANKKLLDKDKKALNEARKNADPKSVADYDKKFNELQRLYDLRKNPSELKNAKAIAENEKNIQRIAELERTLKDYETASSLGDYGRLRREINELESVDKYIDAEKQLTAILKYRHELRAFKRPQTGNIVTKNLKRIKPALKSFKAGNNGANMLAKANKAARAGMSSRSAKFSTWLFDTTLKHGARLARFERDVGFLYTAVAFLGDMYDKTSSTSQEYSNGIEFKPLCLLSADDLEGQDNVVNYGMWLMWEGNSTDPADDDAAYLQAMDFAAKFHYVLEDYQQEHGKKCNVDIYVVRPIIRIDESDPENLTGEMFYLFMNDIPWTTVDDSNGGINSNDPNDPNVYL